MEPMPRMFLLSLAFFTFLCCFSLEWTRNNGFLIQIFSTGLGWMLSHVLEDDSSLSLQSLCITILGFNKGGHFQNFSSPDFFLNGYYIIRHLTKARKEFLLLLQKSMRQRWDCAMCFSKVCIFLYPVF